MNTDEKSPATGASVTTILSDKDTKRLADYKKVFQYFQQKPATMFQCEIDTGIPRPYVCWYVDKLRKTNDIQIVRLGVCPISKWEGVQYLSTDKNLFTNAVEKTTLFDEIWQ